MAALSNTFEAGSDGTTITAGSGGNSGGGPNSDNYFDSLTLVAGGVLEFASAAAYAGSLGMRTATRATTGGANVRWTGSFTSAVDSYGRAYIRATAIPSAAGLFAQWLTDDQVTTIVQLRLNASGHIEVRAGGVVLATSTTTLVAGNYYRIEWHIHADATSPTFELRIYTNPSNPVASYAEDINVTPTASANVGTAWYGPNSTVNWPSTTDYFDMDAIAEAGTTWWGPVAAVLPLTVAAVSATSTVAGSVPTKHKITGAISATSTVAGGIGTTHGGAVLSTYGGGIFGSAVYGGTGAHAGISGLINATSTVSGAVNRLSSGSLSGGIYTPPYSPPTPPPVEAPGTFGPFAQAVYDMLEVDIITSVPNF